MYSKRALTRPIDYILENICSNLQITDTHYKLAEERYNAVGKWLAQKYPLYMTEIYPQGSLKIGTTVKPQGREEYDLDLVCEFRKGIRFVEPKALLENVLQVIKSNDNYSDKTEMKKRCIRIKYANEFHLDILPALPNLNEGGTCLLVPDKDINGGLGGWKPSNPKGYADWFESQCVIPQEYIEKAARIEPLPENESYSDKETLKRVVQLIKRWRNNYFQTNENAPVSIVLTTLAANRYNKEVFLSEALTNVIDGIMQDINQSKGVPLKVFNPTTIEKPELLSEKWINNVNSYNEFCIALRSLWRSWHELLEGNSGMQVFEKRLEILFGGSDGIINKSFIEHSSAISYYRKNDSIGVNKASGVLSALGQSVVNVKKNTFYGQ